MKIRVEYEEADGRTGVVNYLDAFQTNQNTRTIAERFASEWARLMPDTKFKVTERER